MAITAWYAVTIDSQDARKAAAFWSEATGWPIAESDSSDTHVVIRPGPSGPQITFNAVPELKTIKNRLHLDIISDDFEADAARLTLLGATQVSEFGQWTTFRDVEGNEFDLIAR
jgi:predicted enzyme related to lactoylglutathione lyase